MKKGFTLIELLAVIVILAIIALIATPIVLNIINDTKESAVVRSAEYYMDAAENSVATSILKNIKVEDGTYSIMKDGNLCIGILTDNTCDGDILKVEVKGEKPVIGKVIFDGGNILYIDLKVSGQRIMTNGYGKLEQVPNSGLYDKNGKLLASWDELINQYGLDLETWDYSASANKKMIEANFENADKLVIDDSVTSLSAYSLANLSLSSIIIPTSVTSIGEHALYGCNNIKSIVLPVGYDQGGLNTLESALILSGRVGMAQFENSKKLTSVILGPNVTVIEPFAFLNCTNLTNIKLPDSLTTIHNDAFSGSGLTNITIPKNVKELGSYIFSDCENLNSIIVDKKNQKYDSRDNSNAIIETATNTLMYACKATVIPTSVTSIGLEAFTGVNLENLTIPGTVKSIQPYSFYAAGIKNITILDGTTTISGSAFRESELKTITIPSSVTYIGDDAFADSNNLTTIYYSGTATGTTWGAPNATVISK